MTTKASKPAAPFLPYREILQAGFICPEPENRVDSLLQSEHIDESGHLLRDHFSDQPYTLVDTGAFVFYDVNDLMRQRFRPDLYVVFGVDKAAAYRRNGYVIEEAGKPPDFALEVASPSTYRYDLGAKRTLYARTGVGEYWRFDPSGGEMCGDALSGEILVDGTYESFKTYSGPDGMVWGYSPVLDLCLCVKENRLTYYDRKTQTYLLSIGEERAAHLQTAAELDEERAARLLAATERDEESTAHRQAAAERDAAFAEVERLREELRRRTEQ